MFRLHARKATQKVPVTLIDSAGALVTGVVTPTVEITKNGAAYAAPNDGTWAEIDNGDYTVTLDETDTNAVGWLLLRVIKSGSTEETKVYCLVGIDAAEETTMAENIRRLRTEILK